MKKIHVKLIPTKRGYVTDMTDLFKAFIDSGESYAEWVNYPQKNSYVCQISVIVSAKNHKNRTVKACKRKEKVYLVRKDKMDVFLAEIGL